MQNMKNFIDWKGFTPEFAAEKLLAALSKSEEAVSVIESEERETFETLVWALSDATRDLWQYWGWLEHMLSVMNSDAWRKVEEEFQPKIIAFSLRVGQSKKIYEMAKRVQTSDPTRRRILDHMIQSAELAGVALNEADRKVFNETQAELARLGTEFSNAVLDATKAFSFTKDGKTYTIDDANYPQTMKNCEDREVRETLCRARATRAGENTERIAKILALRSRIAKLLGFDNYAELSLKTKCAPSVDAVQKMIDELDLATAEASKKEDAELGENLAPWDMAFAAERLREKRYNYSEEELKKFFEFQDVLAGLFKMSKFLFNMDVKELTDDKPSVWDDSVRVFEVSENGVTRAYFYLDAYVRNGRKNGGAWVNGFRGRCDRRGETPLTFVALNLLPPDENGKTFMPFREVETLFHEFGHACQHMLTNIGEEDAAGINLVEWDAVEVASQFMENWCLDDRTGIVVPSELKAKVRAAKNYRAASACRRQLAFAMTDLHLHLGESNDDANAYKTKVFKHFGMPLVENDVFLNSFTHIFSGGYAAGYYGYKWAEVMSADCFGAFEEAGLDNDEAIRALGEKYRNTILGLGGSLSAYDVFIKFRSRPPTIDAILRQQGLK